MTFGANVGGTPKKGCLETEVSISAIIRKIKDKVLGGQTSVLSKAILAGEDIKVSELIDALKQEDPLCLDIVSAAANELGKYLSGVACLFDPDSIILAGPLSGLPEYCFLDHVRLSFQRYIPRFLKKDINFSVSTKGKDSSIIGACLIARDSSSLEDKAMRKTENGKTMKIPFIKYLEYMDEYQLSSALVRNTAGAAIDVVNWPQLYPYAPKCLVRLARSHTHFVISFSVSGMDLRATEMEDNGRSWEDSCCEFFISPDGKTYYNIEITCIGSIRIGKGTGRNDRTLVDKSEVARVKRWSSLEKKRYEEEGGNYHWTVTALIPYSVIGIDADNLPTEFRGNFFKCGDRTAHPHFISWNPIKSDNPDFHKPEFFGKLLLVEE